MQEVQKVRTDYEGKVKALLTDDQKNKFETALKDRPTGGVGGFCGAGGFGGFGGAGGAGGFGGAARVQTPKELTSTEVQDKLNLTKEQKDKIAKLKKEFEEQTQSVLTDEQKKKFEEIKKEQPVPHADRARAVAAAALGAEAAARRALEAGALGRPRGQPESFAGREVIRSSTG